MITRLLYVFLAYFIFSLVNVIKAEDFVEGIDYQHIPTPFATSAESGKVEVIEVFWYGCPHCYALEPVINSWRRPENIDFKLMPAISEKGWAATGAQAFYTAQALGILDKVHSRMFTAIHQDKRTALLTDPEAIADFFSDYGVSDDDFYKAWNSFSVHVNLKQATDTFTRSGIAGVPTMLINGKYITTPSLAGGGKRMRKLIEYLADKESGK